MKPVYGLTWASKLWVIAALLLSAPALTAEHLPDFTELAESSAPAVVNISTKQASKSSRSPHGHQFQIPDLPEDSPLYEFFQRFFGEDFSGGIDELPERFNTESLGSGFIISPDGYIMTNHHVVKGADEIIVRMSDRREFMAELVGSDKATDVALIKIEGSELPTVKLGLSADLKVGEWVLAIGSPFGFDHSVTAGIVSAKGRSLPTENYVPFIQTDVAINPGNSGGPLFNLDGEVIGINSQIYSRTGGFMGLSFAIPIGVAINVADQLRTKGKVSRGWLGVLIQDVTYELAESFGMDQPMGALVAQVLDEGPAKKAGIKVGDVIVSFNGTPIRKSSELPPLVGSADIDRLAEVGVLRNRETQVFKVNIGELPEDALQAATGSKGPTGQEKKFGFDVSDLTAKQREELEIESGGAHVDAVRPGAAATSGIRPGDVVTMVNNHQVTGADDLLQKLEQAAGEKSVAILVQREEGARFIALKVPQDE